MAHGDFAARSGTSLVTGGFSLRLGLPLFAVLFATPALVACESGRAPGESPPNREAAGNPPYVIDDFGDTLFLRPARRVVSLTPASTEILFALGGGTRLVGRGQFDLWPDSARLLPDMGPGLRPNVEALLQAKPDLVLLYASGDNRAAARRLRQAGIATAAFKTDSIAHFDRLTRLLGRLIGDSARGAQVADSVRRTLDSVRALTRALPRVRVVMPSWEQPLIIIGGGSFQSELVAIAGGVNVYDSIAAPSATVSFEDVVLREPDAVLAGPERAAVIRRNPRWRALQAVRDGRVLVVDTGLVLRPAVRLGEGAVSLARLLHPAISGLP